VTWVLHVCDVCLLLDGDDSEKPCFYCPACNAFICQADEHQWIRRARAAAIIQAEMLAGN